MNSHLVIERMNVGRLRELMSKTWLLVKSQKH